MQQLRWEPAVYEHKAALIGKSPSEVSSSPELLHAALTAEWDTYRADYMTVGIDVYNVEAEACGARVVQVSPQSCPEIPEPIWHLNELPEQLDVPGIPESGRFTVLLDAARGFRDSVNATGHSPPRIRIAASGPVSIASKLVGTETLLVGLVNGDSSVDRLLDFCCEVSSFWLRAIRLAGFDAAVFDSTASPPLLSPDLYETYAMPHHRRLMHFLADSGQEERPLVLGGDTSPVAGFLATTGANQLVCDFSSDPAAFSGALAVKPVDLTIRRNLNPAALAGDRPFDVERYCADLLVLAPSIAGTGILPYNQDPALVTHFRDAVNQQWMQIHGGTTYER